MVDKMHISGKNIYITKGMQTITELNPPTQSGFPIQHLKNFIKSLPALNGDSQNMTQDLISIKESAKLPGSRWD